MVIDRDFDFSTTLAVPPTVEPVTVQEVKDHLRIDTDADDNMIESLITAARVMAEQDTSLQFNNATWVLRLRRFPWEIKMPHAPLVSVSSIEYIDTAGVTQTLDASKYRVDNSSQPGVITPEWGQVWPSVRGVTNSVIITYVAGFGSSAADVPEPLRLAVKQIVGHFYEHRETVAESAMQLSDVPYLTRSLLESYKVWSF